MVNWVKVYLLKRKARNKLLKILKTNSPWCNSYAKSIVGKSDEVVMEAVARLTNYPTLKDVIQAVAKLSNYPTISEIALFLEVDPRDKEEMARLSAIVNDLIANKDLEQVRLNHGLKGRIDISTYRTTKVNPV